MGIAKSSRVKSGQIGGSMHPDVGEFSGRTNKKDVMNLERECKFISTIFAKMNDKISQ